MPCNYRKSQGLKVLYLQSTIEEQEAKEKLSRLMTGGINPWLLPWLGSEAGLDLCCGERRGDMRGVVSGSFQL